VFVRKAGVGFALGEETRPHNPLQGVYKEPLAVGDCAAVWFQHLLSASVLLAENS
jgi:hypothetical protein